MSNAQGQQGLSEQLEKMKTLRDEIRVDLHLAGMEVKDRWQQLEPKVLEAERRAKEFGAKVIDELVQDLLSIRDKMRGK